MFDKLKDPAVVEQLRQLISMDLTYNQIATALEKWSNGILPYPETFPVFSLSASGQVDTQALQIDGSYGLVVWGISVIETGDNIDSLINTFNINSLTNLIGSNPLPTGMIYQYTGLPVAWPQSVPPNATISVQVQSGSTGACDIYITLWTLRVPADVIDGIKKEYGIR